MDPLTLTGAVDPHLRPIVLLELHGENGTIEFVETIVDTGCTLALYLPARFVFSLGLKKRSVVPIILADGTTLPTQTYAARVMWQGVSRSVQIATTSGGFALAGMRLLYASNLAVEALPDGLVQITPV